MAVKKHFTIDGKVHAVPEHTVALYMEKLHISAEDAARLYLEENGKIYNEEYEKMNKKAEQNDREFTQVPHNKKTTRKSSNKQDTVKENFISDLYDWLSNRENISSAEITNKSKLVRFNLEDETFELNLIRKRGSK